MPASSLPIRYGRSGGGDPPPCLHAKTFYGQASRSISTGQLNALLHLHTRPINVVVSRITSYNVCYTKLLRSMDRQGVFTTINKSAEKLLKIKMGKVLGRSFREVIGSDQLPMVKEILRELIDSEKDSIRKQITMHRITSYNVCYTKLLHGDLPAAAGAPDNSPHYG